MNLKSLTIGLVVLCVSAHAADLIPIEDFAKNPSQSNLQLSSDGRYCASLRAVDGRNSIEFMDLASATVRKFDLGQIQSMLPGGQRRSILRYRWLGSKRILAVVVDGVIAFDREGRDFRALSGRAAARTENMVLSTSKDWLFLEDPFYVFQDDVHALMPNHPWDGASPTLYTDAINMNTETGSYETVVKNPGEVISWMADSGGIVRAGIRQKSIEDINVIYRDDEKRPWRPLAELSNLHSEPPALYGLSTDGKGLFVATNNANGYKALYRCDLATGKLGEPLLETPGYDVGTAGEAVWSDDRQVLLGFSYMTDGPHLKCFDEEFARRMAEIDSLLPNTFNRPVSIADNGRRILVYSGSDRNPGAYYLYSTDTKKLDPILRVRPWLKPEQMAPMNPIAYTARDGLEIHGYITIPLGQKPRNLPLVVLPHDLPFGAGARDRWSFQPFVQMLASRGYAVLQMNYRGSSGYGQSFLKHGGRELAGMIQQDIEDAARWAIAKKVADPKRIAVVGDNRIGGFSALCALYRNPDLYCCGISMFGIVDWLEPYRNLRGRESTLFREQLTKMTGDPETEKERLKAISPVNFADKITRPVLFIYHESDLYVSPRTVRKMAASSEKAGGKPEVLITDYGANIEERNRIERYKAIEAFLAKYLGPGATASTANKSALATAPTATAQPTEK